MKGDLDFARRKRFAPLFFTQFAGAFNDNLFKTTLFVLISFYGLGQNDWLPSYHLLNLGALLFVLPYFLFSSIAGQMATRWNKAAVARWTKVLEVAVMGLAAWGFVIQSAALLLFCLFVMGSQSALFGPVKYSILPEYLRDKELIMGNGLIESGTFVAILLGQIIGTLVAGLPAFYLGMMVLAVAVLGLGGSLFMPAVPAREPDAPVEWRMWRSTRSLLRQTFAQKELYTAIVGISWFWAVGAVYTTQLPTFVQTNLGADDSVFNLMLALFSIGIAAGSVLCARLSHGNLNLRWVAVGALGLSVCGTVLVWLVSGLQHDVSQLQGLAAFLTQWRAYPVIAVMAGIGFFGGFFSVPLYTWLQTASSDAFRAHAIAANNIVNGIFMVAAALLSSLLLFAFDNIAVLYLAVALGNLPLLAYLLRCSPRFRADCAWRKRV